jgi:hypothetical protein
MRSVAEKSHLEVQATAWRELAKRARRLAGTLLDDPARERLLNYLAAELEEKAAQLEVGVSPSEPPSVPGEAQQMRKPTGPK